MADIVKAGSRAGAPDRAEKCFDYRQASGIIQRFGVLISFWLLLYCL